MHAHIHIRLVCVRVRWGKNCGIRTDGRYEQGVSRRRIVNQLKSLVEFNMKPCGSGDPCGSRKAVETSWIVYFQNQGLVAQPLPVSSLTH